MDFVADKISKRLGGVNFGKTTGSYKFSIIKEAKANARMKYPNISLIDMGVGEPDLAADSKIVEILSQEAGKLENRFYSDNGINEFQEAAAQYMKKVYGVEIENSYKNILHGIGSKPILAMIPSIFVNPDEYVLTTTPGYPIIATWTKYLGGKVFNLELKEENNFYPDFSLIPEKILQKAKLLYINYPNNPTGQIATKEFFEEVVKFAYKNNVFVVNDAAYASLTYDGYKPISFLSIKEAMNVGIEIHSLSKSFNMTGWRIAFAVGNSKAISAYGTVKDNTDSGQFRAIQKAGIYALNHSEITDKICEKYSRRLGVLVEALNEAGFCAKKPKATFYCYVKSPKGVKAGIRFKSAEEAAKYLIEEALVSVIPWDDSGAWLRFSATFEADTKEKEIFIINELKERLLKLNLEF